MQIDWLTVVAQIVNFLVLVLLLKRFLYGPILSAMQKREARIAERLENAKFREDEAAAERRRFERMSEELESSRAQKLGEAREVADLEKRRLFEEARAEVAAQRDRWLDDLGREQDELGADLRSELGESAFGIARRALADLADSTLERQVVRAFLARWVRLPASDRAAFSGAGETLRVSSAFELDADLRERLLEAVAPRAGIEFTVDAALVCGIVLVAPGHRLDWSIDSYLDDAALRLRDRLAAAGEVPSEVA